MQGRWNQAREGADYATKITAVQSRFSDTFGLRKNTVTKSHNVTKSNDFMK